MLPTPVRNDGSQGRAETKRVISFPQPEQAAITGQVAEIEAGIDRHRKAGHKRERGGRLGHKAPAGGGDVVSHPTLGRFVSLVNNPG